MKNNSISNGTYSVTFLKVLRSESIKFWSLRSNYFLLISIFVFMVGIAFLHSSLLVETYNNYEGTMNSNSSSIVAFEFLSGLILAILFFACLSSVAVTNEYSTGMIISTFSVYPNKIYAMLAKLFHSVIITLCVGVVSIILSYVAVQMVRSGNNLGYKLFTSAVLLSIFSALFYLVCITIIAFSMGVLLRSSAASIAAISGLFFVLPLFAPMLAGDSLSRFTPTSLGSRLIDIQRNSIIESSDYLSTQLQSIPVIVLSLLVWSLGSLAVALCVLTKRDV